MYYYLGDTLHCCLQAFQKHITYFCIFCFLLTTEGAAMAQKYNPILHLE